MVRVFTTTPTEFVGSYSDNSEDVLNSPRSKWRGDQKIALLVLRRLFNLEWKDVASIMNETFRRELEADGFFGHGLGKDGLGVGAMRSQHDTLLREPSEPSERVYLTSFDNLQVAFRPLIKRLRSAAEYLGIRLKERSSSPEIRSLTGKAIKRKRTRDDSTSTSSSESLRLWNDSDEDNGVPRLNFSTSSSLPSKNKIAGPKRTTALPSYDGLPLVAFRVWDDSSQGHNTPHGFRAEKQLPRHIADNDVLLEPHGICHVDRDEKSSPFISISSSLIWMLQMAHKFEADFSRVGLVRIAVIDPRQVARKTRVFSAKAFCAKRGALKKSKRYYKGVYEYLCWQYIPKEAIIGVVSLQEIQELMSQSRPVRTLVNFVNGAKCMHTTRSGLDVNNKLASEEVGQAVGHLARAIHPSTFFQDPFVSDLARCILQNWNISKVGNDWNLNAEFCTGLKDGLERFREGLISKRPTQKFASVVVPETPSETRISTGGFTLSEPVRTTKFITSSASEVIVLDEDVEDPKYTSETSRKDLVASAASCPNLWIHSPYD